MTARLEVIRRPAALADYRAPSKHRPLGFILALIGLMVAGVSFVANIVGANLSDPVDGAETLAWSWGVNTTGFAVIKVAIAAILIGIVYRLWMRVDSVKYSLIRLRKPVDPVIQTGDVDTPWGVATQGAATPKPLLIHRMARRMWAPMLAMGTMAVVAGLVTSFVWSTKVSGGTNQAAQAWTQGLQFLGEGFLLAGIAFLLGTILAGLREGGGEVQESLGVTVRTLKMPLTVKLFVGFMMLGVMVSVFQFVAYIVAATGDGGLTFASWSAWLGPTREVGLGLIVAGIVLALVTIGDVLAFQFSRVREIVATGN